MRGVHLGTLVLMLAACSNKPEDDSDLRGAFSNVLKDPSSLQFQKVAESDDRICGEYNAKNGFGAYDGFEVFVFARKTKDLQTEGEALDEGGDTYKAFLNSVDACPNSTDLMLPMLERHTKALNSQLRSEG